MLLTLNILHAIRMKRELFSHSNRLRGRVVTANKMFGFCGVQNEAKKFDAYKPSLRYSNEISGPKTEMMRVVMKIGLNLPLALASL